MENAEEIGYQLSASQWLLILAELQKHKNSIVEEILMIEALEFYHDDIISPDLADCLEYDITACCQSYGLKDINIFAEDTLIDIRHQITCQQNSDQIIIFLTDQQWFLVDYMLKNINAILRKDLNSSSPKAYKSAKEISQRLTTFASLRQAIGISFYKIESTTVYPQTI